MNINHGCSVVHFLCVHIPMKKKTTLRMYCIDRAGMTESHDAHAFYCLYDYCILAKVP